MVSSRKPKEPTIVVRTIGETIDEIFAMRELKRAAAAEEKKHGEAIALLEIELLALLDAQKTDAGRGKFASVTISEVSTGNVLDWEEVWPWMSRTKQWQLVQKRISDPSYRELRKMGKVIPGIQDFTKRNVNVRVLPSP